MFDEHRNKASHEKDKLKCSASELLGIYGIFRHWVDTHIGDREEIRLERASLDACLHVVDVILEAKRGIVTMAQSAHALRSAIKTHLEAHIRAYGKDDLKPKHHWLWDIAQQWLSCPCVLDAFIIERIHNRARDAAVHVINTSQFEESVLAGYIASHRQSIQRVRFQDSLVGPQQALPSAPSVHVADSMALLSCTLRFHRGDFVIRLPEGIVGEVVACLQEEGHLYAILVMYRKVQDGAQLSSASSWRRTEEHALVKAEALQACIAWYWRQGDVATVLER